MSNSIFMGVMEAIRDAIRTLELADITSDEVAVRRLPYDSQNHWYRGVTIHPVPEEYDEGTNEREAIGYGCGIAMVQNNDNDSDYKLDQLLLWREKIRQYFVENSSISGEGTVFTLKVEHGYVIDFNVLPERNYDLSRLVIRAYSLEERT